jgi:hypothetical protein
MRRRSGAVAKARVRDLGDDDRVSRAAADKDEAEGKLTIVADANYQFLYGECP